MLLCDAAQEVGGKLYILGGGWSVIWLPGLPTPVTLAVKLAVPWDQANHPHAVRAALVDDDGEPVDFGTGPVEASGQVEVGRPPGLKPGTPLDVAFVLPFGFLAFAPGGYVWELFVDENPVARTPFRVMPGPPPGMPVPPGYVPPAQES
jgi:hypothetical protein